MSYLCSTRTPKPLNNAQPTTNREQCQTCLNIAEVQRRKRLLEAQMSGSFYFYTTMSLEDINGQLTDTMVQCRLFSLHSAFSIVSENAIKSTEVSLLYKYAILRSHETGGLMTKSKGIILWTYVHGCMVVRR